MFSSCIVQFKFQFDTVDIIQYLFSGIVYLISIISCFYVVAMVTIHCIFNMQVPLICVFLEKIQLIYFSLFFNLNFYFSLNIW